MKKFKVNVLVESKYNPTERSLIVETDTKELAERFALSEFKGLKRSRDLMGIYVPNGKVKILSVEEVKNKK